jgi:neopullulanase
MHGMPQVCSGDEIAMQGGEDRDNRPNFPGGFHDVKDANVPHCRQPKTMVEAFTNK